MDVVLSCRVVEWDLAVFVLDVGVGARLEEAVGCCRADLDGEV